jgi:hypothetical protein
MVTLAGAGRDYPPTDADGFMAFARSLRHPVIYDTIRDARPLTEITGYRRTENRRRHYERMRRWPERFVVVGDAACAFNPVYGQGMSVAALTARALDRALHDRPYLRGAERAFQNTVADTGAGAWLLATSEDLRYPTTEGSRTTMTTRLSHAYLDRVLRAATSDPAVSEAFVDVMTLLRQPSSLFDPRIATSALRRHDRLAEPPFRTVGAFSHADVA